MTDEIKKTEEKKEIKQEEEKPSNNLIEQAVQLAGRIEEGNKRFEEIAKRFEAAQAQAILGGKTDMGVQPAPKKELTPKEYADLISKGIDPNKN